MQENWQYSQKPVYMAEILLRHLYLEDLYICFTSSYLHINIYLLKIGTSGEIKKQVS